jgi:ABC-type multidrug transport system ATPase subunit
VIRIKNYSKKYGSFQAVHPTNLHVREGETYALLGPNGGGKTTVLKSIVGLSRPDSGSVLIAGENMWQNPESVKDRLSFLPQRVTIPENLTPREVLEFFVRMKGAQPDRIDEILGHIDVKGNLDQKIGELSGGMLQRLGLVIAFLGETPVYVLDEPSLNLDLDGVKRLRHYVNILKGMGKTIIFSSHTMVDAESMADRVGVMVKGHLVLDQLVADFRNRVKDQTNMVLVLASQIPSLIETALGAGASTAEYENGYFRYCADQTSQIKVLEAIREAGGDIINISTEKPGLDQLIEEHYE